MIACRNDFHQRIVNRRQFLIRSWILREHRESERLRYRLFRLTAREATTIPETQFVLMVASMLTRRRDQVVRLTVI